MVDLITTAGGGTTEIDGLFPTVGVAAGGVGKGAGAAGLGGTGAGAGCTAGAAARATTGGLTAAVAGVELCGAVDPGREPLVLPLLNISRISASLGGTAALPVSSCSALL